MIQISSATLWRSGDAKPVAILPGNPSGLATQYRLVFEPRIDDLGVYQMAAIELGDGQQARLIKYDDDDDQGTLVFVDAGADAPSTLDLIVREFGLGPAELLWTLEPVPA